MTLVSDRYYCTRVAPQQVWNCRYNSVYVDANLDIANRRGRRVYDALCCTVTLSSTNPSGARMRDHSSDASLAFKSPIAILADVYTGVAPLAGAPPQ